MAAVVKYVVRSPKSDASDTKPLIRAGSAGKAGVVAPSWGWIDRHNTTSVALRTSSRAPGGSSRSTSPVTPGRALHPVTADAEPSPAVSVSPVFPVPAVPVPVSPVNPGGMPPWRPPGGSDPRAASMGMCDCSRDWSMRV